MCPRRAPRKDPRMVDQRTAGKPVAAQTPDQRNNCREGDSPGDGWEVQGDGWGAQGDEWEGDKEVEGDECSAVVSEPRLAH